MKWRDRLPQPFAGCAVLDAGTVAGREDRATEIISSLVRQHFDNLHCTWEQTSVLQGKNKKCKITKMAELLCLLKEKIKSANKGIGK